MGEEAAPESEERKADEERGEAEKVPAETALAYLVDEASRAYLTRPF